MRRARRMLSVALLICIVWNLGHEDIYLRFFKKEKTRTCYCSVMLQYRAATVLWWPFISPPKALGDIHSFSYSG